MATAHDETDCQVPLAQCGRLSSLTQDVLTRGKVGFLSRRSRPHFTKEESKSGAASERTPLSSATTAPGAAGQEAGVRPAHVKTKQGPTPSNSRRRPPKDRWATTKERWAPSLEPDGANPRTGFQVPYAVSLNIDRHLKLSEVARGHYRRCLWCFSTWTSAVTSLLHVYGRILFRLLSLWPRSLLST